MHFHEFLGAIGPEVESAEEEAFTLFSQEIPSQNLGFVDSRANTIDVTIQGRDIQIRQSPTILSSTRAGGTTGAVLWKITPLIAEWLSSKQNILWTSSILSQDSTVVELGCGTSGLIALTLAPSVSHYIATDQEYVHKLLKENLEANTTTITADSTTPRRNDHHRQRRGSRKLPSNKSSNAQHSPSPSRPHKGTSAGNITFAELDWELDSPSTLKQAIMLSSSLEKPKRKRTPTEVEQEGEEEEEDLGFDLLLACDCIYNDALIDPFVQTCADICRLRPGFAPLSSNAPQTQLWAPPMIPVKKTQPTVCLIAQQLRAPDVFESWLQAALAEFWVWRVCDEVIEKGMGEGLGLGLKGGSGYVVHVLVLKE
ncbi:hypothetical protein AJ78_02076 [Emergomyces pasteurianus Ep9510]|uniref:Uncharacterized protein n=1 Tax=Emergomyces pasteurianus Ep9510 TaxID=1447872 RepID=A0A1J9QC64_9EURO|nr:hypothetical protein AJ78_02076 [Emergomyces pasteurianus Ep9510]